MGTVTQKEYRALRTKAIESLMIEKGVLTEGMVDTIVGAYENDIGPLRGARAVARAWVDDEFRQRLVDDATPALREIGVEGLAAQRVVAVANTPQVHNMIVCTLCSCYPWAVLGLPPRWYKSPEYRGRVVREPRGVLGDFGVELPEEVEVRVWDSSSEVRYMVLPERPAGSEDLSEEQLVELVTRDSMIGTGLPTPPGR